MKKLLFLLLLLPAMALTAQVDISLQGGYSVAMSDYGSINATNSDAMYAGTGADLALWAGVRVTDFMGVNIALTGSSQAVQDYSLAADAGVPYSNFSTDHYYSTGALMGGVYFFFGDKVQITGRLAAGPANFNAANFTIFGNGDVVSIQNNADGSVAWMVQPELNFQLTHWLSAGIYGNYYRSHHDVTTSTYYNYQLQNTRDGETTLEILNLGVAVSFHIGAGGE